MIYNHTFKIARPLLWKIEKHFNLNLLVTAGYHKAMALYDCILIIAERKAKETGQFVIDINNKTDWALIMAELINQKTNN